jgi:hypothetical protein
MIKKKMHAKTSTKIDWNSDLEDLIKKFMSNPIDIDDIKWMILRLQGEFAEYQLQEPKMNIHKFDYEYKLSAYIISIKIPRVQSYLFCLKDWIMDDLSWFPEIRRSKDSDLESRLNLHITKWLDEHPEHVTLLE